MSRAGALLAIVAVGAALSGCATLEGRRCPAGQERLRTAQLFFGRDVAGKPAVSESEFRRFLDDQLTPRFPDGLTVLDGGGQWKGEENRLIREAAKVVLIVLPKEGDSQKNLDAVRQAYKARFKQDSVLLVTQPACVSL